MSEAINISDELVFDARVIAENSARSVAEQIELWAHLGRAIDRLIDGSCALALRRSGAATPLSQCLGTVDSPDGRKRVRDYLEMRPFPHFEPAPRGDGLLVRIEEDGTRTIGRFVGREFRAIE